MRRRRAAWTSAVALACALFLAGPLRADIANTKHNLSANAPAGNTFRATSDTRICVFCHTPHNSSPSAPLWNRKNPGTNYVPYSSSTMKALTGQPTGSSLLCLSCHDGTIALGEVLNGVISMTKQLKDATPASASLLGTDLSGDHPISFVYDAALASNRGELANPSTLTGGVVRLDSANQMQCNTCHDAHDNTNGKFLVMSNAASALCQKCHVKANWASGSHAASPKTWNGVGTPPWPHTSGTTVAANACENCHRPHTAPGKKWLQNAVAEEANCYPCHNGNVATKNILTEFAKTSIHPIAATTGVHDPAEPAVITTRHVECVDCHNSHASTPTPLPSSTATFPRALPGSLTGASGVDVNNNPIKPVTADYQVCYRCHGSSSGQPAPKTARIVAPINTRLDFLTSNKSCHPVAGACPQVSPGSVLLAPWTNWNSSMAMTCGDCHNNNAGPAAGGTGPAGPHGSTNPSLLERAYTGTRPALCAKCHTTTYVKFNSSSSHSKHTGDIAATCNTCHDPHGSANYPSMINFDTSQVTKFVKFTPSTAGTANNGSCSLTCHGKTHNNCSYTDC